MEQSTAYSIMLFLPVIPWFLKLTISYKIRYKTPKLNVEKFYKKNKSSFIKRYFYCDLKDRIHPLIYYANFLAGCLLAFSILLSMIYLILAIFRYKLSILLIPKSFTWISVVLTVILIIFGTLDIIDDKLKK